MRTRRAPIPATHHRAGLGAVLFLTIVAAAARANAAEVVNTDFSQGDFAALAWKAQGALDIFDYQAAN